MELQTTKEILNKRYSTKGWLEEDEDEALLKAMKQLMPQTAKAKEKDKYKLVDKNVFDFNHYSVVSPFVKELPLSKADSS